jgi:hypothetical protein
MSAESSQKRRLSLAAVSFIAVLAVHMSPATAYADTCQFCLFYCPQTAEFCDLNCAFMTEKDCNWIGDPCRPEHGGEIEVICWTPTR